MKAQTKGAVGIWTTVLLFVVVVALFPKTVGASGSAKGTVSANLGTVSWGEPINLVCSGRSQGVFTPKWITGPWLGYVIGKVQWCPAGGKCLNKYFHFDFIVVETYVRVSINSNFSAGAWPNQIGYGLTIWGKSYCQVRR